jgi:hypothetical protein
MRRCLKRQCWRGVCVVVVDHSDIQHSSHLLSNLSYKKITLTPLILGHGQNYVETDVAANRVQRVYNPRTRSHELQITGDVSVQNAQFVKR